MQIHQHLNREHNAPYTGHTILTRVDSMYTYIYIYIYIYIHTHTNIYKYINTSTGNITLPTQATQYSQGSILYIYIYIYTHTYANTSTPQQGT